MRHLSSIMIASIVAPRLNENLQLIFELLLNISNKIEFDGQKRTQFSNGFLEEHSAASNYSLNNPLGYSQNRINKELLKFKMSYEMCSDSLVEYSISCKTLLPIINALIAKDTFVNRYYIIKGLELFIKLTSISENELFFIFTPSEFLENLIYLLSVCNTTIIENNLADNIIPENFIIIGDPYGKTRPVLGLSTPIVQTTQQHYNQAQQNYSSISSSGTFPSSITTTNFSNYAGSNNNPSTFGGSSAAANTPQMDRVIIPNNMMNDQIDTELRDLAIESLYYLCRISLENRRKVCQIPNAMKLIFKIASQPFQNLNYYNNYQKIASVVDGGVPSNNNITNVNPIKSEMSTKAAYLFTLFAVVPEAENVFKSLRTELYLLACSDDIFAGNISFCFCFLPFMQD
jgi:hypothetical protein